MNGIFISYSHEDGSTAEKLEEKLRERGISIWRDRESIYAGEHWPRAIGEGIAAQRIFLLLWSEHSAKSHFVEFEWNTALALKKTIVPLFLDDTELPAALEAKNGIFFDSIDTAVDKILALPDTPAAPDPTQNRRVIDSLGKIKEKSVKPVLEEVKTIYNQQGWVVEGNVYQAEGDINITIKEKEGPKKWWEKWQAKILFFVALLALLTFVLDLPQKVKGFYDTITGPPAPTCTLKGVVLDSEGMPVSGAKITLDELPGESITTNSDGNFKFEKVPGNPGDDIRIKVYVGGEMRRDEYAVLPGPVAITLEEK